MVDLYRSTNCTMDDAEYVDTLRIDNLIAHPNGEPDITFTVSLDENNKLKAKIVDTETGASSKSSITLVSRTIEERLQMDDYTISDSKLSSAEVSSDGLLIYTEEGEILVKISNKENGSRTFNNTSAKFDIKLEKDYECPYC